jgi:hypothetical protein
MDPGKTMLKQAVENGIHLDGEQRFRTYAAMQECGRNGAGSRAQFNDAMASGRQGRHHHLRELPTRGGDGGHAARIFHPLAKKR